MTTLRGIALFLLMTLGAAEAHGQISVPGGGTPGPGPTVTTKPGRRVPTTSPPPPVREFAPPRPDNVLVIVADDLGVDMIPSYGVGSDLPNVPTIEGMVNDGVRFTNAWSNPTCSPTRATIQTGRYAFRTGIGSIIDLDQSFGQTVDALALDEVTLPEMLDAGTSGRYAHAAIGKWHLGTTGVGGPLAPNMAGYGHYAGALTNLGGGGDYYNWERVENGDAALSTVYVTTQNVDDALAFIHSVPEPWFCYLAFTAPHSPFHEPPAELHGVDLSGDDDRSKYKAMVEALDSEMGRLFAGISGAVLDRTNVLFLGDNGTPGTVMAAGADPTKAKGTVYDGGVHVPLIVTGPAVERTGKVSEALVNTTDIFATIAELAGVDLAATFPTLVHDSVSFAPQLANSAAPSTRTVLLTEQFNPNGAAPPTWPLPCTVPTGFVCQPDIGFGGPGTTTLSICGEALYGITIADLTVAGAPPDASGLLFYGTESNPTPFQGGILVPFPNFTLLGFVTDAFGEYHEEIFGGLGFGSLYYQAFIQDPLQVGGWSVTNAVRADYYPLDRRAIGDGRYKLILNTVSCEEQLYDLSVDPTESSDLLLGTLTPEQQAAHDGLRVLLEQTVVVGS